MVIFRDFCPYILKTTPLNTKLMGRAYIYVRDPFKDIGRAVWVLGAELLHQKLLGVKGAQKHACLRWSVLEHFCSKTLEI